MMNTEVSTRVPLIISAPWLRSGHGKAHRGMASLIDLFRTCSDLAGLSPSTVDPSVEGNSLAAAVAEPAVAGAPYAFSQVQRDSLADLRVGDAPGGICTGKDPVSGLTSLGCGADSVQIAEADGFFAPEEMVPMDKLQWMGYTVRSQSWRYTEWFRCPSPQHDEHKTPSPCKLVQTMSNLFQLKSSLRVLPGNGKLLKPIVPPEPALMELYDHRGVTAAFDPDAAEYENLAHEPQRSADIAAMREVLLSYIGGHTAASRAGE